MRILLGITVVAVLIVGAWASIPAKQHDTVSIDPAKLTATATKTNLPTQQYDAF